MADDYTFRRVAPGVIEVNKWEAWEPYPIATYRITDGKCNCPDALARGNRNCKHVRLVHEQVIAQGRQADLTTVT